MTKARGFIGIYMYYYIWIKSFSIIILPIFYLFKKDVSFI
jgi:hypothetical protein